MCVSVCWPLGNMSRCGVPTFTCILLLLFTGALYATADLPDGETEEMTPDDVTDVHVRLARSPQILDVASRVNNNNRGRQGRIADSGGTVDETTPRRARPGRRGGRRRGGNRGRGNPGRGNRGRGSGRSPVGVNRRTLRMAHRLSNASTPFATSLFSKANPDVRTDWVMSPHSIHTALTLASLGARGRTLTEMTRTLGLRRVRLKEMRAHRAYQALLSSFSHTHRNVHLHSANALFVRPNIPLEQAFRQGLSQYYNAQFAAFDLNHPQGPEEPINTWVSNQTSGEIRSLLPQGSINERTAMVLVNAIYLNATWTYPFNPRLTRPMPFQSPDLGLVTMDMMQAVNVYRYANHTNAEVVELPYRGDRLAMCILLPHVGSSLGQLVSQITDSDSQGSNTLQNMLDIMAPTSLRVTLPKFKVESTQRGLQESLRDMGINRAFDVNRANFSGISNVGLFIQKIFHKAIVEVTEDGTTAAASTAVYFGMRSPSVQASVEVKMDRPFLFLIRDKPMNTVLFMGVFLGQTEEDIMAE